MQQKVLTGDRPTGSLHLGHYVGSLKQRVELQKTSSQTILIADLQGLTDNGHNPRKVACSRLKKILEECLQEVLRPIRQRRAEFVSDKAGLTDILRTGTEKARSETRGIVHEMKAAFGLDILG